MPPLIGLSAMLVWQCLTELMRPGASTITIRIDQRYDTPWMKLSSCSLRTMTDLEAENKPMPFLEHFVFHSEAFQGYGRAGR